MSAFPLPPASAHLAAGDLRPEVPASGTGLALLGVGEPDFATPQPIVQAGLDALTAGWTHNGDLNGDPELRELAAEIAGNVSSHPFRPVQVLVTCGATSGVSIAVAATVSPGDQVVLLDPSYSLFASSVLAAGGEPVYVPLDETGHLDLDRLDIALTSARAIIVVNPANPIGTVFRKGRTRAARRTHHQAQQRRDRRRSL